MRFLRQWSALYTSTSRMPIYETDKRLYALPSYDVNCAWCYGWNKSLSLDFSAFLEILELKIFGNPHFEVLQRAKKSLNTKLALQQGTVRIARNKTMAVFLELLKQVNSILRQILGCETGADWPVGLPGWGPKGPLSKGPRGHLLCWKKNTSGS